MDSGVIGKVKSVEADLCLPSAAVPGGYDNIMYNYSLAGGAGLAAGCSSLFLPFTSSFEAYILISALPIGYPLNAVEYLLGLKNATLTSATATPLAHPDTARFSKIDQAMRATFSFPSDVTASIFSDLAHPNVFFGLIPRFPKMTVEVVGEEGSARLDGYVFPSLWHTIVVTKKGGARETVKAYTFGNGGKGENWWST